MSGNKVNKSETPESILGIDNSVREEEQIARPPVCTIFSIVILLLGTGLAFFLLHTMNPGDGSWAMPELLWFIGVMILSSTVSFGLAIFALFRSERWPLLTILAVVASGGVCLMFVMAILSG